MISEKIATLKNIKSDIASAINDKGGSVGDDFTQYADAIRGLEGGGGADITDIQNAIWGSTMYNDWQITELTSREMSDPVECVYVGSESFRNLDRIYQLNKNFNLPIYVYSLERYLTFEEVLEQFGGNLPTITVPIETLGEKLNLLRGAIGDNAIEYERDNGQRETINRDSNIAYIIEGIAKTYGNGGGSSDSVAIQNIRDNITFVSLGDVPDEELGSVINQAHQEEINGIYYITNIYNDCLDQIRNALVEKGVTSEDVDYGSLSEIIRNLEVSN